GSGSAIYTQMKANNEWREGWREKVDPGDIAVKFCVVLSDIDLILGKLWTETISVGEIVDASAKIFLIFKPHMAFSPDQFGKGHVLVFTPVNYEGVLVEIADLIGVAPALGPKIEEAANNALPKMHKYFAEIMLRIVHNMYKKRYIDAQIDGDNLIVS